MAIELIKFFKIKSIFKFLLNTIEFFHFFNPYF